MIKAFICWISCLLALAVHGQEMAAQNIVVVTLDGYRWQEVFNGADTSLLHHRQFISQDINNLEKRYGGASSAVRREKLMPFLWTVIAKQGQLYGNRQLDCPVTVSNPYWFSYPGYNEIFTGYPDTAINSNSYPDNPNSNVIEFLNRQPELRGRVAAFASWGAFNRILNEKRSGFLVNAGYEDLNLDHLTPLQQELNRYQHRYSLPLFTGLRLSASTFAIGFEYLKQQKPRVLVLGFGDTDHFAHHGDYDFYLDAAKTEDDMLRELWTWLQSDPQYRDNTILFVTTDHGRGLDEQWTSHGRKYAHSSEIWFAAIGPGIRPLGERSRQPEIFQNQFAAAFAGLLGYSFDAGHPVGASLAPRLLGN